MDAFVERLDSEKRHAAERIKQITEGAEARAKEPDYKGLSAEELTELEAANKAIDDIDAQARKWAEYRAKVKAADEARPATEAILREQRQEMANAAKPNPNAWLTRAHMEHDGTEYESARTIPLGFERRALATTSGTFGPTTFADFVTVYERTLNPMLDVANVISTRTGNPLVFPRITADVTAGGSVTAQAGSITEGDPTYSTVQLTSFKIAHTTLYSAELDQDEVVGLDQLLADAISRPIGLGWGTFFTLGTGTTQPWGFLARATNAGTALGTANGTSNDTYWSPTDTITLFYSLAAPYRSRGAWQTNSVAKMRSFKDTTGQLLWTPGNLALGQPDTYLGRPVYENPAMAAAGSANTSIAFGDFSRYVIRDVTPMRIDISRDYKFNTDQLALRVVTRRDGDLIDTVAVKFLVSQAV